MFRLGAGRKPFDADEVLDSGFTISRFEHAATHSDVYRASRALVEQYIAGFATPPKALVYDLDHSEDQVHGQQLLAFYNHHYRSTCYLPLYLRWLEWRLGHGGTPSRQATNGCRECDDLWPGVEADSPVLSRYPHPGAR